MDTRRRLGYLALGVRRSNTPGGARWALRWKSVSALGSGCSRRRRRLSPGAEPLFHPVNRAEQQRASLGVNSRVGRVRAVPAHHVGQALLDGHDAPIRPDRLIGIDLCVTDR